MNTVLLIIVIALLIYLISDRNEEVKQVKEHSIAEVLPGYKGKYCEVTLKQPLMMIEIPYSVKGIIVDFDSEWILIEGNKGKKQIQKIFRISLAAGIKEVYDYKKKQDT